MSNIKKGVSLVALIITIIVLIILTGAVIITMNQGNIIGKSEEAVFKSDLTNFRDQFVRNILDKQAKMEITGKSDERLSNVIGDDLRDWVPSITDKYIDKLEIKEGNLYYKDTENEQEYGWAAEIDMIDISNLLAGQVEVGDYVEYEPDPLPEGETSVTVEEKTAPKENLKWRVLKNDGTNVTLISDSPTTSKITFSGAADWVNAPTILNSVCDQLYSKEGVGVARSIDVDDVNEITGYNGNDWQYFDASGYRVSVPSNVRTIGELETSVGRRVSDTNRQTPETGKPLADYAPNYYYYTGTAKGLSSSEMTYKLIFRKADNSGYAPEYWLSSSCVLASFGYSNNNTRFDVRSVGSDCVYAYEVFYSSGMTYSFAFGARPLVTLRTNVQVDIEEGRDGTTAEKAWKIK